ncbi:P120' protein [Metamycoplasma auris 15026]|uniref:p120' protein n=1 Tax=Metamycoplasma auris 15026 TaxID=1188233 RepID=N9TSU7_9BACT|nr:DUF885 family protein [Metamycoplasma auris]ENY69150.1 P120' protein [Metamycoplasma auris 15026]
MSPKTKKGLILTGIVSGVIIAPVAFALIPYGIQQGVFAKENKRLIDKYNLKNEEFKAKTQETNKALEAKNEELKKVRAELDKTKEDGEQKKKLQAQIDSLDKEIKKLESENKKVFDELIFPVLEEVATKGYGQVNQNIIDLTALYITSQYEKFLASKDKLAETIDVNFPTKEESAKVIAFYTDWISKLEKIKKRNLNVTSTAWASGLKEEWDISKGLYESEIRLIGGYLKGGPASSYPLNSFYETINDITKEEAPKLQRNLEEGIKSNVVLSKVVIKNNIRSILSNHYTTELKELVKDSNGDKEETVLNIIKKSKTVDENLKKFHEFYVSKYYAAADHGLGENIKELKVSNKNKINELEDSIEVDGKLVYGLGLTQKDLEAKDVGIGSIKGSEKTTTGKRLYDIILKMSTTNNETSQEVYDSGYETTKTAVHNMEAAAKAVATLITGDDKSEWSPTIKYNPKGLSGDKVEDLKLNIRDKEGKINLGEFNKWMNQERFFFGREGKEYYTETKMKELVDDSNLKDSIEALKNLKYESLKGSDKKYGTITEKQFYYGALEAFKAYKQFKQRTIDHGYSYFAQKVPEYDIRAYEFSKRTFSGVGAYNGYFIFNPDPYYSLPKWSVTSFANHESVMGHHNQVTYADKFLKKINGHTIGNIFDYTSYIEGWALFMEWFGIEAGLYGTPDFNSEDYYALPVSFKKSHGITSFIKADKKEDVTADEIKEMKTLHGGVYWDIAANGKEVKDEKEHTLKAAELTNILQYYGALNEAQLRNMRRAVDNAFHGSVEPNKELPANASILDIRKFMKENSALGVGDIAAESKRYLNNPGQSVSYNTGKESMLKLYDAVRKSKGLSRKAFVENKENIKEFTNIILETGALPLGALEEIVKLHYNL